MIKVISGVWENVFPWIWQINLGCGFIYLFIYMFTVQVRNIQFILPAQCHDSEQLSDSDGKTLFLFPCLHLQDWQAGILLAIPG